MHRPVTAALAILLLVPTIALTSGTAGAIHEDGPVPPARITATVFRDVIFEINDTLAGIEEQVGADDPRLRQARASLKGAAEDHNRGNDWLALPKMMESLWVAQRAQIEHETRGASDPNAAFFSRAESKWQEGQGWISDVHQRMIHLQDRGVDLYMLDNALLAGDILADGERLYKLWPEFARSWEENDQRGNEIKNALVAYSYGPILYARVADAIITKGLQEEPEEPVGPIIGNAQLRGVAEKIQPLIQNRSVSFDRTMVQIVQGNLAEEEWLAGLGAMSRWATKQASAAVQHTFDKPDVTYNTTLMNEHLLGILENDTTQEELTAMDVPGAHARYHLSKGVVSYLLAERDAQDENMTNQAMLESAEGLGAMSGAHMSLAIIKLAAGEDPPNEVVHLPERSALLDASEHGSDTQDDEGDEPEENTTGAISGWWWIAAFVAAAGVLFVLANRRD